jgi:hypothetical protein
MAIVKCPECKTEVSDKATTCPSCAYPIKKYLSKESAKKLLGRAQFFSAIFMVAGIVIGLMALFTLRGSTRIFTTIIDVAKKSPEITALLDATEIELSFMTEMSFIFLIGGAILGIGGAIGLIISSIRQ